MGSHVYPWWGGYFLDNRLRRWLHNPERILAPYVRPGITALDFGCGMGMFAIAMAKLVGEAVSGSRGPPFSHAANRVPRTRTLPFRGRSGLVVVKWRTAGILRRR